jgi:enhancing lycopene biosynthesis protein 2
MQVRSGIRALVFLNPFFLFFKVPQLDFSTQRSIHVDAVKEVERLGAKHVVCDVTEIHVDEEHKLVTAPAFMCETSVSLLLSACSWAELHGSP